MIFDSYSCRATTPAAIGRWCCAPMEIIGMLSVYRCRLAASNWLFPVRRKRNIGLTSLRLQYSHAFFLAKRCHYRLEGDTDQTSHCSDAVVGHSVLDWTARWQPYSHWAYLRHHRFFPRQVNVEFELKCTEQRCTLIVCSARASISDRCWVSAPFSGRCLPMNVFSVRNSSRIYSKPV